MPIESYRKYTFLAYFSYQNPAKAWDSLQKGREKINMITPSWYSFDKNMNITGRGFDEELASFTTKNNIHLYPLLANYDPITKGTNKELLIELLKDTKLQTALINNLENELSQKRLTGINIDLEATPPEMREQFTNFIKTLYELFQQKKLKVILSIPAKISDLPKHSWVGAYDYAELQKYSDYIVLMTYNESYENGPAGPLTSDIYLSEIITYSKKTIPSEKLILAFSGQGLVWVNNQGSRINRELIDTYENSPKYIKKYTKGSVVLNGNEQSIWYDDTFTMKNKIQTSFTAGIKGIGLWNLGNEPKDFWELLK